jgi:hypothetical protein
MKTLTHFLWAEDVTLFMMRITASGIWDKLMYDPVPLEALIRWTPEVNNQEKLSVQHVLGPTMFLLTSLVISLVVYLLEWCHTTRGRKLLFVNVD